MKARMAAFVAFGILFAGAMAAVSSQQRSLVVLSLDGLSAETIAHAGELGVNLPRLTAFRAEGAGARAVVNVAPTLTYPNHTTLLTGVAPDRHLVLNNLVFDPEGVRNNDVYWFADAIRVPTLWDAAHAAGGKVVNVYWPVAVGSPSIDINFPEIWAGGQPKNWSLIAALSTTRLLAGDTKDERKANLMQLIEPTTGGDAERIELACTILEREKPNLTTVHLVSLDETQHHHGINSPAALKVLTSLDAIAGRMIDCARANNPQVVIAVLSDHGQVAMAREVNLGILLVNAGLIKPRAERAGALSWRAAMWTAGGAAYLVAADTAARAAAMKVLADYAGEPGSPVARIVPVDRTIPDRPDARIAAVIFFQPGFAAGNALSGKLIVPSREKGQHGGSPDEAALRSMFIVAGPGVPRGRDLGVIDMRAIAPTLAHLLAVPFPTADQQPLF